jgi:hypothetical protein
MSKRITSAGFYRSRYTDQFGNEKYIATTQVSLCLVHLNLKVINFACISSLKQQMHGELSHALMSQP